MGKKVFSYEDTQLIAKALKKLKRICRCNGKNILLVDNAYNYAYEKHKGVFRKDGSPYIIHCLEVASILADLDRSDEEIAAGILHDTVEDTDVTTDMIAQHFGPQVSRIVEAVTNMEPYLPDDCELQKEEIDELSDKKLIEAILANCPEALYVKVADRLHNLATMGAIDNKRRVEKVNDTRAVLIPLVKELAHAYSLAHRLEDACLLAEQPQVYTQINERYRQLLQENSNHLPEMSDYISGAFSGEKGSRIYDVNCYFCERTIYSIHDGLIALTGNKEELLSSFTLRNVPLLDIFFVVKDVCEVEPEQVFFELYKILRTGSGLPDFDDEKRDVFELTIVGFGTSRNSKFNYFVAADCYEVRYRIFCKKESDYREYIDGYGIQQIMENCRNIQVNAEIPSNTFVQTITVYTRKQQPIKIEAGATVLDFAFQLHPKLALGAKYAYLNKQKERIPLYTKLNHGDTVEIISSTANDKPENEPYEEHAKIRWEEWVNTRKARKALTRYLEEKEGKNMPLIMVQDTNSRTDYELPFNAVALDLAFAVDPKQALFFEKAYLNKSKKPCAIGKRLEYSDKVRIEYGEVPNPSFDWLRYVKTEAARSALIDYFANKIQA